jgi:hypothetical protein
VDTAIDSEDRNAKSKYPTRYSEGTGTEQGALHEESPPGNVLDRTHSTGDEQLPDVAPFEPDEIVDDSIG